MASPTFEMFSRILRPRPRFSPFRFGSILLLCALGGLGGCDEGAPGKSGGGEGASTAPTASESARDVILITLDTLRADALGFEESPWSTPTPWMERVAREGRRFTFAHAHNTVTLPSHANLLTGRYPFEHGVRENTGFILGSDVPTAASVLADAGFATGAFVSAYTLDSRYGLDRGFEVYDDQLSSTALFQVGERRGDVAVERALAWWRSESSRRRFLWLHLFDPHAPYEAPPEHAARFDEPYRGEVAAVDAFLEALEPELVAGGGERPLLVITADHGEALGDHGELTHGVFAYQSTLRVPLILWGPGVDAGVDDRLARHIDVLPTLLEGAGVPAPKPVGAAPSGHSLLASPPSDVTSYFECLGPALERGWAPLRGLIRGRHKFIDLPLPELYDLEADPGELTNLVDGERRLYRELEGLMPPMSAWPPARGDIDPEEAARLRSLGYLADSAAVRDRYGPDDDPKRLIGLDALIHEFSGAFAAGAYAQAEGLARQLVAKRPSMPVGHTQLAHALLAQGRRTDAVEVMLGAQRQGWASPGLKRQLALTLAEVGRAGEALPLLEGLRGDLDAESAYAQVLRELGRVQEAQAVLLQLLEREPGHAASWERLSTVALDLGDAASAAVHARRALELEGGRAVSLNNLGVARLLGGDADGAFEAWQQALAVDPTAYDTLYNLGMQAARLGRRDLAVSSLRRFLDEATAERYAGDRPKARAVLRQLGG